MIELSIDAFNNFECIGNLCEDHCCREWSISIDKSTYDNYEKEDNEEFKRIFKHAVSKIKDGGEYNYAIMNLNMNGECMFLDDKKLCSIYKLIGPESMCHTCRVYPRYSVNLDEFIQKTISLSCPEACRKVLLRKEPIEFNLRKIDESEDTTVNKVIMFDQKGCFSKDVFIELRSFVIDLLQDRNYSIEERLITLGLFIEDINGKDEQEILKITNKYVSDIANNSYKGITNYIDTKNILDMEIRYSIKSYLRVISKFTNTKLRKNMLNMRDGLKISEDISFEELKENYIDIKNKYYNPFIEEYKYVFENYLVNYVFRNMLMYSSENLFKDYAEMIVYYSMIKFAIIGVCGNFKENMDESKLILTISTFLRGVEHNKNNVEALKGLVEECNLECLSNLIPLILM